MHRTEDTETLEMGVKSAQLRAQQLESEVKSEEKRTFLHVRSGIVQS